MAFESPSPARRRAFLWVSVAAVLLLVLLIWNPGGTPATDPLAGEGDVAAGEVAFDATCAACHGLGAVGTNEGPTFLDPIYRPGHHADGAFLAAVRLGVRQHHWPFGNMPPQDGISNQDINNIVAYVRQLQQAAGIQ
ncbi:MAG: cytochrome c [Actinomycetota bacterium]|nr:cytochrome c [Actinomycetota bacterium]